jgi:uncharacterized protein (TIGR03067 family)
MRYLAFIAALAFVVAACPFSLADDAQKVRIARAIEQLGDESFKQREAASKELQAIGEPALSALREAAASNLDPEIRSRAAQLVTDILERRLAIAAKRELEKLQGTWHSVSSEANGAPLAGENKADKHIFAGGKWTYQYGGVVQQVATVKIVEVGDKSVKIDFQIIGGYRPGDTWVGIYELSGDELKWCGGYAGEGTARPAAFGTKAGDGLYLRSLKRDEK